MPFHLASRVKFKLKIFFFLVFSTMRALLTFLFFFFSFLIHGIYHSLPVVQRQPSLLPPQTPRKLRILIDILTLPAKHSERHFLRLVYGIQPPVPGATVDVRFILCRLTTDERKLMVSLEILRFGDVIILNCTENMSGIGDLGYALSWDLVEWIATSEIPLNDMLGFEDMLVGKWLESQRSIVDSTQISGRESQEAGRGQRTTVAPTSASPCGREAPMHMLRIVHVSSALSTSAAGHFEKFRLMRKEKFRLISGHFEKFGLINDKKKVRTHIWYI